jgi:hypothetical protein
VVQEWDEFDFSAITYDHTMHDGSVLKGISSPEYLFKVTTTAPDGSVSAGHAQGEAFVSRYVPYGFIDDPARGGSGE